MSSIVDFGEYILKKTYIKVFMATGLVVFVCVLFSNIVLGLQPGPQAQDARDLMSASTAPGQVAGLVDDERVSSSLGNVSQNVIPTSSIIQDADAVLPTQTPKKLKKNEYKIAVFGDSMVDTMGDDLPYLKDALKKKYPNTTFKLYNYGKGGETVDDGLARFKDPFSYSGRNYKSIIELNPDVIILGSFGYNPVVPYDRDHHWLTLTKLVEEAKETGADVYVLAENAPLRTDFGKGPKGVNWDSVSAYEHSGKIIQQIQNAISLSKNLNVLLIDVFDKTIVSNRTEGKKELVNTSDGIHPSKEGHEFIANEIVNTLVLD